MSEIARPPPRPGPASGGRHRASVAHRRASRGQQGRRPPRVGQHVHPGRRVQAQRRVALGHVRPACPQALRDRGDPRVHRGVIGAEQENTHNVCTVPARVPDGPPDRDRRAGDTAERLGCAVCRTAPPRPAACRRPVGGARSRSHASQRPGAAAASRAARRPGWPLALRLLSSRPVRWGFVAVAVGLGAYAVADEWTQVRAGLASLGFLAVAGALVSVLLGLWRPCRCGGCCWQRSARRWPSAPRPGSFSSASSASTCPARSGRSWRRWSWAPRTGCRGTARPAPRC